MSSEKLNYFSIGKTIDGTNYCSGVETLAENIIEDNENDAVIVFPSKDKWAKLRSESYRMTSDNTEAFLPLSIYKVNKFLLKVDNITFTIENGETTLKLSDFIDQNGNTCSGEFDITSYVVSSKEWNALPVASEGHISNIPKYCYGFYKDNTFYWEEGNNKISFLGTVYKKGITILDGLFADNTPTFERLIRSLIANGEDYTAKNIYSFRAMSNRYTILNFDVRDWLFRIEYVPVSSKTKIRARKSEKQSVEYLQPFNQRAEINAASAFGKNMWLTAQKTGTREITVVKNYTRLADIPPLGALVKHNGKCYRLVANSYLQTNTVYLQVTHTLSENWTSKSKHVSVNQKYRNYKIPQDILWRNMYWEDYITVSGTKKTVNTSEPSGVDLADAIHAFDVYSTLDKTIDSFCWLFDGSVTDSSKGIGVTVPCSTYGIANSMVFSATFKDNLSAGLKENFSEEYLCEEALYCNDNGRIEYARVILSDGLGNGSYTIESGLKELEGEGLEIQARRAYPVIMTASGYTYNAPKTPLFNKKFYVDKDPGEAIKFTYQVHFVTEDDCVVGNKLAENNPLIQRYENSAKARSFKVWLLKSYIRDGADKLETTLHDVAYTHEGTGAGFNITLTDSTADGRFTNAEISLNEGFLAELRGYVAWAITDENDNLYVGRNENTSGKVYFCISHKRP